MDSYFSSNSDVDDFGSFGSSDALSPAPAPSADLPNPAVTADAPAGGGGEVNIGGVQHEPDANGATAAGASSFDYFAHSANPDDPFSSFPPPAHTQQEIFTQHHRSAEPVQVQQGMAGAMGEVDLGGGAAQQDVSSDPPSSSAYFPVSSSSSSSFEEIAAPPTASSQPVSSDASSVSSYFGAGADDVFGSSGPLDTVPIESATASASAGAPVAAVGGLSYFGGADATADDPFAGAVQVSGDATQVEGSGVPYFGDFSGAEDPFGTSNAAAPIEAGSGVSYFDAAPADDWMNAGAGGQQNQQFSAFPPPQHDPFPAHPTPHYPQPSPAAAASFPPSTLAAPQPSVHAQAPGGPVVSSNSNTPALPSQPAPPAAVGDYFSASDDWMGGQPAVEAIAPAPQAQPLHPQAASFPPPMPPQPHALYKPYAESSSRSSSLPVSRQISDLGDVDLDSPATRPTHGQTASVGEMAEIPLSGPTPSQPVSAPQQQQNAYGGYGGGYARGGEERDPYAARPPPSSTQPTLTTVPAPLNPYQPPPPSQPPQPGYAGMPPIPQTESGRALPPSTFMPRAPVAATQPPVGAWQPPVPTPASTQQPQMSPYGQPMTGMHPQQPMQTAPTAHAPQQPYGHPNPSQSPHQPPSSLFSPPSSLFSPGGTPQRVWTPAPAFPIVHFGFGGRLVTMIPRGQGTAASCGPITLTPLTTLLESHTFLQKLSSFPGPLCQATAPARHPRHVELEDLVQAGADRAMYSQLPTDSTLHDLSLRDPSQKEHLLSNFRQSKRLLDLLLLECLRRNGKIHRASNPTSITTLPSPPSDKGITVEEHLLPYLIQLSDSSQKQKETWLSNENVGGEQVPNPVRGGGTEVEKVMEERRNSDAVTAQLQLLLLTGQRKEACLLAMEKKLWSHALLLASFDMATYHLVVGRFATEQFSDGSPLQSLYLLFAQQPNLLFRGIAGPDGKGMDGTVIEGPHLPVFNSPSTPPLLRHWRSSLSIFLSNPTPNDKQVLTTLGDTLWQNYQLQHAAHTVYCLAGHGLGPEIPGSLPSALPLGRILLLGADHRKHMRTFATPAAIQRTEVWEYTRQLAAMVQGQAQGCSPVPFVGLSPAFTLFKLHYAYQLAEVGLNQRALMYVEHLTAIVQSHSKSGKGSLSFPLSFLSSLESLDHRLRENLNKAAGPGIGKKLVNKLFNWMVGDSAQATGAITTVVAPEVQAPPPSSLPRSVSSSSIPPVVKQQQQQMTNSASSQALSATSIPETLPPQPPTHARSATEPQPGLSGTPKESPSATVKSSIEQEGGEVKPGLFGSIVGSLWGKKKGKKVHKAHIREESSFTFDETLQKWVQRDANGNIVEEEEEKAPPPPSISAEMAEKLRSMSSAPPPVPGLSASPPMPGGSPAAASALPGMPPPASMFASRGAGTKNRYALADNSYEDASAPSSAAPALPTPGLPTMFPTPTAAGPAAAPGQFKVFRPAVAPPGEQYGVPPQTQPAQANGTAGYEQQLQQQQQPGNGFHAPAGAQMPLQQPMAGSPSIPGHSMPGQHQPAGYGAPPPSHPPQQTFAPTYGAPPQQPGHAPYGHPAMSSQPSGYAAPYGGPPADLRAQSTPPMRPGSMPPYGNPPYNPLGAPTMPRPGMMPGPQPTHPYGAPYVPPRPPAY
jgi:hypothetical protein